MLTLLAIQPSFALLFHKGEDPFVFNEVDGSSFSNLESFKTKSYELNMTIDLDSQVVLTKARYNFSIHQKTDTVLLDIAGLKIKSVRLIEGIQQNKQTPLNFSEHYPKEHADLGGYLNITLPKNHSTLFKHLGIAIDCQTTNTYPTVASISWASKEQTADKISPFMYTQSQTIYTRSIFPCQDSPAIKSTFLATIYTKPGIRAFASGNLTDYLQRSTYTYQTFNQSVPIPSYLFALVAGTLKMVYLDQRIYLITEPSQVERCVKELVDLPIYLQELQQYVNMEYPWGQYGIVILPPSFPLGGMENPQITFASPSIIVGDHSNVNVAIHQMAHSWTGNLVTCRNWSSFWLNEGYTVFLQNKINREIYGQQLYNITSYLFQKDLNNTLLQLGLNNPYTALNPRLKHENPDDAYTIVPYYKGYQFLSYVERLVGQKVMQEFTGVYLLRYEFESITTQDLFIYMRYFFTLKNKELQFRKIDWDKWINGTGFPPVNFQYKSASLTSVLQLAAFYKANDPRFLQNFPALLNNNTVAGAKLKTIFFNEINDGVVSTEKARNLDSSFNISATLNNFQVLTPWFLYCLANSYVDVIPIIDQRLLTKIGRTKFISPLYKSINKLDHEEAVRLFNKNKMLYHPIAVNEISKALNI